MLAVVSSVSSSFDDNNMNKNSNSGKEKQQILRNFLSYSDLPSSFNNNSGRRTLKNNNEKMQPQDVGHAHTIIFENIESSLSLMDKNDYQREENENHNNHRYLAWTQNNNNDNDVFPIENQDDFVMLFADELRSTICTNNNNSNTPSLSSPSSCDAQVYKTVLTGRSLVQDLSSLNHHEDIAKFLPHDFPNKYLRTLQAVLDGVHSIGFNNYNEIDIALENLEWMLEELLMNQNEEEENHQTIAITSLSVAIESAKLWKRVHSDPTHIFYHLPNLDSFDDSFYSNNNNDNKGRQRRRKLIIDDHDNNNEYENSNNHRQRRLLNLGRVIKFDILGAIIGASDKVITGDVATAPVSAAMQSAASSMFGFLISIVGGGGGGGDESDNNDDGINVGGGDHVGHTTDDGIEVLGTVVNQEQLENTAGGVTGFLSNFGLGGGGNNNNSPSDNNDDRSVSGPSNGIDKNDDNRYDDDIISM